MTYTHLLCRRCHEEITIEEDARNKGYCDECAEMMVELRLTGRSAIDRKVEAKTAENRYQALIGLIWYLVVTIVLIALIITMTS
ncbi:MAG: hypothetical protein ACE5NN_00995 [Candidatus Bathyarchaeia archaeon]